MRKRGDTHLEVEAADTSENLVIVPNLLDDSVRATHNDGTGGA